MTTAPSRRVHRRTNAILDSALIIVGAGLSTLFVSTDGNGQNPLPVVAAVLVLVFIVGVVSFVLAWLVRDIALAVLASIVITELLFLLYFVCRVAFSRHVHEHVAEELYLLPFVFAVVTAPTILLSSIGIGRFAHRFFQRRHTL